LDQKQYRSESNINMKHQLKLHRQSQLITRGSRTLSWCAGVILLGTVLSWVGTVSRAHAACRQGCDLDYDNTFLGNDALINNTIGTNNTAIGDVALYSNTAGLDNTASGALALYSNTSGSNNTASGSNALLYNTTGGYNTGTGIDALYRNNGWFNTATGAAALLNNTTVRLQHGHRGRCALFQHYRRLQHG
jgi:hypothetical protein